MLHLFVKTLWKHFLFLKFTDELLTMRPGIFIKKINKVNFDFMLSSQRHREEQLQ